MEEGGETVKIKLISNGMVEITDFVPVDKEALGIKEKVRFSVLKEILDQNDSLEEIEEAVRKNLGRLIPKHIIKGRHFRYRQLSEHPGLRRGYRGRHRPLGQPPDPLRG